MGLKNLNSVGNVIDEDGVTYPMLVDGGYDIFGGIHIDDIDLLEQTAEEYYAMKAELAMGI